MSRAGFVVLAGRPNVGKSTLVNTVVGEKVAIVSDRPQTTRRAIRGVHRRDDVEIVLVDLPGVQRPRDALTMRMARTVTQELEGSDAALLILSGEQRVGAGDRYIAKTLVEAQLPVVVAVNKVDKLSRASLLSALQQAAEVGAGEEVFPISARTGEGVAELMSHLGTLVPDGPFMYSREAVSDQPLEVLVAELVREAAVRRTFQEVPHAVEVFLEELEEPREDLVRVQASIWVETESQKGILIGSGGRMIKAIGVAARRELERALGRQVHLQLSVRVRRDWRADEGLLDRLGIN
jgi:GTP-binding protein Era